MPRYLFCEKDGSKIVQGLSKDFLKMVHEGILDFTVIPAKAGIQRCLLLFVSKIFRSVVFSFLRENLLDSSLRWNDKGEDAGMTEGSRD